MSRSISILLPTYNCNCVALVTELQRQCALSMIDYELIVADDASLKKEYITANSVIEQLPNVTYLRLSHNIGRSAIRNFLIEKAQKEWLLFIDGDLTLDNTHFIQNYLYSKGQVVVGGITIKDSDGTGQTNLRYVYEKTYEQSNSAQQRQQTACKHFRTTNFLAHKEVMRACPFDENFKQYGYEDVLLGKILESKNIGITHIDNPITLDEFEPNALFLSKTEESLRTLSHFKKQLRGYSKLLTTAEKVEKYHLSPIVRLCYKWTYKTIKHRLISNKPNIFLFNTYKLMYYIHYDHK